MLIAELGKRYERLLFFTAPVSLAAFIALMLASVVSGHETMKVSQCLSVAEADLNANLSHLEDVYRTAKKSARPWDDGAGLAYRLELIEVFTNGFSTECHRIVWPEIYKRNKLAPGTFAKELSDLATAARAKPVQMYGVSLPRNTTIDMFGNEIVVELTAFLKILQIVIFPVLLLWLGSLYQTRHREITHIASVQSIGDVYPHFVNMYLVGRIKQRFPKEKRNELTAISLVVFTACLRAGLVALFVLPPTAAYLLSLEDVLLDLESFWMFMLTLFGLMAIGVFALITVLIEFSEDVIAKVFVTPFDPGAD